MSGRTVEQIRSELAAERAGLHDDVDGLKATLRVRLPLLIAGVVAMALLVVGLFIGVRRLRKRL
jgi:hypothetical protein